MTRIEPAVLPPTTPTAGSTSGSANQSSAPPAGAHPADSSTTPQSSPKDLLTDVDDRTSTLLNLMTGLKRPRPEKNMEREFIKSGPLPTLSFRNQAGRKTASRPAAKNNGPPLARAEREERQQVAHPQQGTGFPFGSAKVNSAQLRDWFNSLSKNERHELRSPHGAITIIGSASAPGSRAVNERLAQRRAEATKAFLHDQLGVRCQVTIETRLTPAGKKDDMRDRVATIRLETDRADTWKRIFPKPKSVARPNKGSLEAQPQRIAQLPPKLRAETRKVIARGGLYRQSGGYYFLRSPHTAEIRAIHRDKIPEGAHKMNGFFVWARGPRTAVRSQFPTTAQGVRAVALAKGKAISDAGIAKVISTNTWLNDRMWAHLQAGKSLDEAQRLMKRDAERARNKILTGIAGICI